MKQKYCKKDFATITYRFNLEVQHCCAKIVRIFVSGKNNPNFF
jgi:hypothetical protein